MLSTLRNYLILLSIALWLGGFTFYAVVVVPTGAEILGSTEQGFVTQQVTAKLNLLGSGVLVLLLWGVLGHRTRVLIGSWAVMAVAQVALFALHPQLDALLNSEDHFVIDLLRFHDLHRGYLIISTVQWCAGMIYVWEIVSACRQSTSKTSPDAVT